MSLSDYIGRTVDVLAYQGARSRGEALLIQQLVSNTNSGQITTGVQKLAQRFLLELLTEQGSMTYLPSRGCTFITEANQGGWRSALDVQAAFSSALTDIEANLTEEESDDDPDDERFDSADLLAVTFTIGSVSLFIQINSVAGTSRTAILPLETII